MNVRATFSLFLLALLAISTSQASAQTYTLGFDQAQYNVVPGATVDITLILTEETTSGQNLRLAPGGDDALFSFGVGVDYSSFSGATGSTFNSLVLGPDFDDGFPSSGSALTDTGTTVFFEGNEDFGDPASNDDGFGVEGTMISSTVYQLELATLTFDAGSLNSLTTLQLQEHDDGRVAELLFGPAATPFQPDDILFGSSRIFVTAVPEPGSAAILALVAGAGLLTRRRK